MHRFVLGKAEILKNFDEELSYEPAWALAMMDEQSLYGDADVGRLMQMHQFKGGRYFDLKRSSDYQAYLTWRNHYIEVDEPFLMVRIAGDKKSTWMVLYKRREVIEAMAKKKHYQTNPDVREKARLNSARSNERRRIADRRGKLIAEI